MSVTGYLKGVTMIFTASDPINHWNTHFSPRYSTGGFPFYGSIGYNQPLFRATNKIPTKSGVLHRFQPDFTLILPRPASSGLHWTRPPNCLLTRRHSIQKFKSVSKGQQAVRAGGVGFGFEIRPPTRVVSIVTSLHSLTSGPIAPIGVDRYD